MPIAFSPVSSWLGQNTFTAEPTGESLLQYSPQTLAQFTAGVPHFDPASIRRAPVPLQTQSTPEQAARAGQVSPASLVGGAPAGLPFSAQVGIGTGPGAGGGATSSVVGRMLSQTSAGAGGGGVGPSSIGPAGGQPEPAGVTIAHGPSTLDLSAFSPQPGYGYDVGFGGSGGQETGSGTGPGGYGGFGGGFGSTSMNPAGAKAKDPFAGLSPQTVSSLLDLAAALSPVDPGAPLGAGGGYQGAINQGGGFGDPSHGDTAVSSPW